MHTDDLPNKENVSEKNQTIEATLERFRGLLAGDEREHQETFEYLKKALDEDRPSGRKLFQQK
jgi:hypothetical protein